MENKLALLLTQLWMAGETCEAIGKRFGVSASTICEWAKRYKLPKRERPQRNKSADPTPEEIAERAAECRERHFAQRRAERDDSVRTKVWKRQQREIRA